MASFFKCSCAFYWIIWIGCLAYYFGTAIFSATYVVSTAKSDEVVKILKFLAFFNVGMSFVGCVFVKCSITHVLCAALYILPVLGVNAAFCIIGIVRVRELVPLTADQLINNIRKTVSVTGSIPEWLFNVQQQLPCCGIHSFLDYPLIFRKANEISSTKLSGVIPISCCQMARSDRQCNLNLDEGPNTTGTEILESLSTNCSTVTFTPPHRYKETDLSRIFNPIENLTDRIFTCGCYEDINTMMSSLYQAHFIFFMSLIFASLVMALIYIKLWCRHRGTNEDSGSDHSLDVDNVSSVHELPEPEPSGSIAYILGSGLIAKSTTTLPSVSGSVSDTPSLKLEPPHPGHTRNPIIPINPRTKSPNNIRRPIPQVPAHSHLAKK